MENEAHKKTKKLLAKDYAGFVLITCKLPSAKGQMQVEMSYEGDPVLAAYLLEGAQGYLDEEEKGQGIGMELLS